jgi:hypothetical protein
MTEREQIEQQIRDVLATETQAIHLSNKLFQPDGLFNRLAKTEEERRLVAQSPLFKQAQARLTVLHKKEMAEFARVVEAAQATLPGDNYLFKLEPSDRR